MMALPKIDYKKDLKHLYQPSAKRLELVEVPAMKFLMVDGHGNPNDNPGYQEVLEALYAMAYSLKFALKPKGFEYVVAPLEGLWWAEDMDDFTRGAKENWDWTMMIMQPDPVTTELFKQVRSEVARKKDLPALDRMRLETYQEGLSVQILYHGPYADEGPTIIRMHAFIKEEGCEPNGKHHEIYLGDPRRTAPEKLRTIIRQPIRKP
jgi:hypothetical protein